MRYRSLYFIASLIPLPHASSRYVILSTRFSRGLYLMTHAGIIMLLFLAGQYGCIGPKCLWFISEHYRPIDDDAAFSFDICFISLKYIAVMASRLIYHYIDCFSAGYIFHRQQKVITYASLCFLSFCCCRSFDISQLGLSRIWWYTLHKNDIFSSSSGSFSRCFWFRWRIMMRRSRRCRHWLLVSHYDTNFMSSIITY